MGKLILYFAFIISINVFSQQVSTYAGSYYGYTDGPAALAQFNDPRGICIDSHGNIIIADTANNRIRKIETTGDHLVSTIAGSGVEGYADGEGVNAVFAAPNGICIDNENNLYVTDALNFKIRKITPAGVVTTVAGTSNGFADGSASTAQFSYLEGICMDDSGNLFVSDGGNNRIRKITPNGVVSTFAGSTGGYQDGVGIFAKFNYPSGICIDQNNNLYVAESFSNKIRKITPLTFVSTVAGGSWGSADGQGIQAQFSYPVGICLDPIGNLFVADSGNHRIRKITPTGSVTTYTGSVKGCIDGDLSSALFKMPSHLIFDTQSNLYITEIGNERIRKISNVVSSVDEVNVFEFELYPNPNHGVFNIEGLQNYGIEIYNLLGQKVFSKSNNANETTVTTELQNGIYLIKITNEEGLVALQKMVVE